MLRYRFSVTFLYCIYHSRAVGEASSGGKIFYQPDDADDFDEEDPDDDLDI